MNGYRITSFVPSRFAKFTRKIEASVYLNEHLAENLFHSILFPSFTFFSILIYNIVEILRNLFTSDEKMCKAFPNVSAISTYFYKKSICCNTNTFKNIL